MTKAKRIVVTGIPGTGSTEFCAKCIETSSNSGKSYNLGDLLLVMAQQAPQKPPVPAENLINLHPELLNALGDRVFDNVLTLINKDQRSNDRLLVDMHAQFFWGDVFTNAYDWRHLARLNADLYVTLIEKPSTIQQRQLLTPQGRSQNYDLRDLLLWQNSEVNITAGWAANFRKPHYVLPGRQDPLTIESLLSSAFLIYFQMPMTDANGEADAKITQFKERLLDVGRQLNGLPTPLIDPRTIDIESGAGVSPKEERAIRLQTIHRDLNWYIAQSSDQVAYYPPGTTLSKGVSDETTRGFETGKNVFVIYPSEHTSPFMDIATRVFTSEAEFFDFYPQYMLQRMQTLSR